MSQLDSNRSEAFHRNYSGSRLDKMDMACLGNAGKQVKINEEPGMELTHWLSLQSVVRQSQKTSGIIQDYVGWSRGLCAGLAATGGLSTEASEVVAPAGDTDWSLTVAGSLWEVVEVARATYDGVWIMNAWLCRGWNMFVYRTVRGLLKKILVDIMWSHLNITFEGECVGQRSANNVELIEGSCILVMIHAYVNFLK